MKKYLIAFLMIAPFTLNASAESTPRSGRLDSRVKHIEYRDGAVYRINAHYFQDTMIVFDQDEKIVHIGAGDPNAWQIVPINNYLSVKPALDDATTNMNILTENIENGRIRTYVFELRAGEVKSIRDKRSTFMLKFSYPEDELRQRMAKLALQNRKIADDVVKERKVSADDWNMNYTFTGETALAPIRAFDDGEFTYFEFPKSIDTPAIFLVDDKKNESLINYHVSGKYIVVKRLGAQFILRDGHLATCIFNNSYQSQVEETTLPINVEEVEKAKKAADDEV